jgi:hypothetical protein
MPYNQTPHSPAKQNPIKKLVDKVLGRGGEVTGGRSSKKAIKSMKKAGLTGLPRADEEILYPKHDPLAPPSIVRKSNTEMNIGKKGRELVQYQRPDGSVVITTKRKARRKQRQQERLENRGMDTRHIPTKF